MDGFVKRYVTAHTTAFVGDLASHVDFTFLIAAWEDLQVQHDIQHLVFYVFLRYEDFEFILPCGFCDYDFSSGFEDVYGGFTGSDGSEVTGLQRAKGNEMESRGVRSCAT